jgi:hypothetical protein
MDAAIAPRPASHWALAAAAKSQQARPRPLEQRSSLHIPHLPERLGQEVDRRRQHILARFGIRQRPAGGSEEENDA